jgi:hypothetical protein
LDLPERDRIDELCGTVLAQFDDDVTSESRE